MPASVLYPQCCCRGSGFIPKGTWTQQGLPWVVSWTSRPPAQRQLLRQTGNRLGPSDPKLEAGKAMLPTQRQLTQWRLVPRQECQQLFPEGVPGSRNPAASNLHEINQDPGSAKTFQHPRVPPKGGANVGEPGASLERAAVRMNKEKERMVGHGVSQSREAEGKGPTAPRANLLPFPHCTLW